MARLLLTLLGTFQASIDGTPVAALPTDKARALLAYLALEAGRPHARASLAALLWPDLPEAAALSNVRKTLHRLRQAFGEAAPGAGSRLLGTTRQAVEIDRARCSLDVDALRTGLALVESHSHHQLHGCRQCLERLVQAAARYRGELLAGLALGDAPEFEEWLLLQREAAQHRALQALYLLAGAYAEQGEYEQAYAYASRQLALDPYREEAHRQAMRALALSGRRSEALAQYAACRHALVDALGVEPAAETIVLHEQIRQGLAPDAEQVTSHPVPRPDAAVPVCNLPPQFTPFVGRASELQQLREMFLDQDCRLVTLLGAGGMGKTRLSIQAAQQLAATSTVVRRAYFIPLADVSTTDGLPGALIAGLGLQPDGQADPLHQVLNYLRIDATLLVLDSFEHLLPGAPLLAEILAGSPNTRMLVTSRLPLELRAERRVPIDGLDRPDPSAAAGAEADGPDNADRPPTGSSSYSAVQLFVHAARRVRPDFTLSPEEGMERDVAHICHLVQGMPLALEMAATWTRVMTCAAIADEIGRSLDFLVSPLRDMPERHRSMEAVFQQSWRLLTPAEQEHLAQLSVFCGPFNLEAATAVAGVSVLEMAALLDKSLVRHAAGGWYELHELMRQFAARRLAGMTSPGLSAFDSRHRHSDHYLRLVAFQERALFGPEPRAAVAVLQRHAGNIRQAWDWAVGQLRVEPVRASLEGLARFYDLTCRYGEIGAMLGQALDQVQAGRGAGPAPAMSSGALAVRLLIWQGHFQERQGRADAAIHSGQAALAMAADLTDVDGQALAHNLLGEVLPHRGAFDEAERHLHLSVAHLEASGCERWLADALLRLGIMQWRRGVYGEAVTYLERAHKAFLSVGDSSGLARVASSTAGVRYEQGALDQALVLAQEAMRLYKAADDRSGMAATAGNLALLYMRLARFTPALEHNQMDLDECRALGDRHGAATALGNRSMIYADAGELERAWACNQEALRIEEALGNGWERARHLSGAGALALRQGEPARALELFDEALPVLRSHGAPYYILTALVDQAETLHLLGRWAEAAAACGEALAIAGELGQQDRVLQCRVLGAKIAHARGDTVKSFEALEALLRAADDRADRAMLHYELWRLGRKAPHAQAAITLYQELYARRPLAVYRTRADELKAALRSHSGAGQPANSKDAARAGRRRGTAGDSHAPA